MVNELFGTVTPYAIDPESGRLRRVSGAPAGKGANWVEIVEFN